MLVSARQLKQQAASLLTSKHPLVFPRDTMKFTRRMFDGLRSPSKRVHLQHSPFSPMRLVRYGIHGRTGGLAEGGGGAPEERSPGKPENGSRGSAERHILRVMSRVGGLARSSWRTGFAAALRHELCRPPARRRKSLRCRLARRMRRSQFVSWSTINPATGASAERSSYA